MNRLLRFISYKSKGIRQAFALWVINQGNKLAKEKYAIIAPHALPKKRASHAEIKIVRGNRYPFVLADHWGNILPRQRSVNIKTEPNAITVVTVEFLMDKTDFEVSDETI